MHNVKNKGNDYSTIGLMKLKLVADYILND